MTARRRAQRWACALLLAALAGCADPFGQRPPQPQPHPAPPLDPALTEPAAKPSAPRPAPEPDPEPPAAAVLMGVTPAQVQDILGTPTLVRRENTVQVMQFEAEDCVLDVTLYEEAPGAPFRTQYVEARRRDGTEIAPQDCLATLIPKERWSDPAAELD